MAGPTSSTGQSTAPSGCVGRSSLRPSIVLDAGRVTVIPWGADPKSKLLKSVSPSRFALLFHHDAKNNPNCC